MFSLPIGTMICFWEGYLVVMLILGLGLLVPLIVLWTSSIFFNESWKKFSLILRISFMFLDNDCVYNHSYFLLEWFRVLTLLFLLWNFDLLSFFLEGLEGIDSSSTNGVERLENSTGFDIRVFLGLLFDALEFMFFVNWAETFCC